MEMILSKEEVYTQRSQGMRGMAALCGEAPGQSGGSRDRENAAKSLYWGFYRKNLMSQVRHAA